MIFTGDIACPSLESLPNLEIPNNLRKKNWFSNLEGAIEESEKGLINKTLVFNNFMVVSELKKKFNIKAVALANNHITDSSSISETIDKLNRLDIDWVGAGNNLKEAKKKCIVKDDSTNVIILNFGWRSISCKEAKSKKPGVNPYEKENVYEQVKKAKKENYKIVVYFHWNYELELYPQPYDRELAFNLIDLGVDAVIGCHAHRVQGAEIYKGRPIVYGLGNFIFPQEKFWNGKLKFPKFCELQLAFEINWKENKFNCHYFEYDKMNNEIVFLGSKELQECERIKELTPFSKKTKKEYKRWFRIRRYQKKMLPVFYYNDSKIVRDLKNLWIQIRHTLIMSILKIRRLYK